MSGEKKVKVKRSRKVFPNMFSDRRLVPEKYLSFKGYETSKYILIFRDPKIF